ncbi:YHS domain-containing protein [Candidatus Bathyarchaeota archaeon]|nr:YHS domain-containing protein [Candidatus Bathyarchaeota archaeon]
MAKDLVCGWEIDERTTNYYTVYKGKTYYFCSAGCREKFEKEPQKYLKK